MGDVKFIYNHVLKCAGTTFKKSVINFYFKGRYCHDTTFKIAVNKSIEREKIRHPIIFEPQEYPKNYRQYDIIFGHFLWSKYNHLKRPKVTFIRDPVERIISNYFYFKTNYVDQFGMKGINILEFANMPLWKNHMVYVLGDINKYEFIGLVECFDVSVQKFCKHFGLAETSQIYKKLRVTNNKFRIDRKTKDKIKDLNIIDMKLYDKVVKKFYT